MQRRPPGAGFVEDREEAAARVERLLGGYSFRDRALLEDALTHSVHRRRGAAAADAARCKYDRLKFLGDAALGLAFSTLFYREDPAFSPGDLTELRSANVSNEKLARVAVDHHLYELLHRDNCAQLDHDVIHFSESVRGTMTYSGEIIKAPKVLADIVEAIAGAVYVDCQFDLTELQKVAESLCVPIITTLYKHPKSMLHELCQKYRKALDIQTSSSGEPFVANVIVDGKLVGIGSGRKKQAAELNAARDALHSLTAGEEGPENGSQDVAGDLRAIRLEEA